MMIGQMDITDITGAIGTKQVRITDHANGEDEADRLTFDKVCFSVFGGEIIEDAQPADAQRLGVWREEPLGCPDYSPPARSHSMDQVAEKERDR